MKSILQCAALCSLYCETFWSEHWPEWESCCLSISAESQSKPIKRSGCERWRWPDAASSWFWIIWYIKSQPWPEGNRSVWRMDNNPVQMYWPASQVCTTLNLCVEIRPNETNSINSIVWAEARHQRSTDSYQASLLLKELMQGAKMKWRATLKLCEAMGW